MDAVEFLKEAVRMCDTYGGCKGCYGETNACFNSDTDRRENPEGVVAAVEKFAAEIPKATRQAKFLLVCPEATLDADGLLCIMPCQINKQARDAKMSGYCNSDCRDCRKKYWLAEAK